VEYGRIFSRALRESLPPPWFALQTSWRIQFLQPSEVKDALAYVRLAMHPEDDISLLRVLNPARRAASVRRLWTRCAKQPASGCTSLWAAIENSSGVHPRVSRAVYAAGTSGLVRQAAGICVWQKTQILHDQILETFRSMDM